jgi:hypothetical protein
MGKGDQFFEEKGCDFYIGSSIKARAWDLAAHKVAPGHA